MFYKAVLLSNHLAVEKSTVSCLCESTTTLWCLPLAGQLICLPCSANTGLNRFILLFEISFTVVGVDKNVWQKCTILIAFCLKYCRNSLHEIWQEFIRCSEFIPTWATWIIIPNNLSATLKLFCITHQFHILIYMKAKLGKLGLQSASLVILKRGLICWKWGKTRP